MMWLKSKQGVMVIVVTLMVALLASPSLGQQESTGWSEPYLVGDGWWPSQTVDQQGVYHLTWYDVLDFNDEAQDGLYYARRDLNGEWRNAGDVLYTGPGGFTVRNAVAVTGDGILHAAFRGNVAHYTTRASVVGALSAFNWDANWRQINSTGYYLSMIADQDSVLHVVFSGRVPGEPEPQTVYLESNQCIDCQNLFYRRSSDSGQTWSDPFPISLLPGTGSDRPSIQQGASGRLYIAWDEGQDWYVGGGVSTDVRLVYSDDNGRTWSDPVVVDGGGLRGKRPIQLAHAELRDGSWMIIWRYNSQDDNAIYYQLSQDDGETWTVPAAIPGIFARDINETPLDDYALVVDRLGLVHAFVVGQTAADAVNHPSIFHMFYQPTSGAWLPPRRVFYSPDMRPEWPQANIGLTNDIHLAWFVRTMPENPPPNTCTTCGLKIYYSYLAGNLPSLPTQAFVPTQTPLPTPTFFQAIDPTTTPFPTVSVQGNSVRSVTTDMYAAETLVGGLAAAALFCGLILLLARIRRG